MLKHLMRFAGWSLFEKGVEKTVDAKLGHLFGPGTKPKRNPPPRDPAPYGDPDDEDDEDDDDEWEDDDDEFDDDDEDGDDDDEPE